MAHNLWVKVDTPVRRPSTKEDDSEASHRIIHRGVQYFTEKKTSLVSFQMVHNLVKTGMLMLIAIPKIVDF